MRKALATLLIITALIAPAAAESSSRFYANQTTLEPGNTTEVGKIEVTATGNTTLQDVRPSINLPFNYSFSPENIDSISNGSRNFTLTVSPGSSFQPQKINRTLTVQGQNTEFSHQIMLKVPEYNNWELSQKNYSTSLETGDEGVLGYLTIDQIGNVERDIQASYKGNITDLFDGIPEENLYPEVDGNLTLRYNIPDSQEPGTYKGQLVVSEKQANVSEEVNITVNISDEEAPRYQFPLVKDMEATQTQTFKIKFKDNVGMQKVVGELYKIEQETRQVNNTTRTVRVNESVSTFEFEKKEDTDVYQYEFDKSGDTGDYRLVIKGTDRYNNTNTTVEEFEIKQLQSLSLIDDTIGVGEIVKGQTKSADIFKIEDPTEVKVEWVALTPENASVDIAIKKQGDSAGKPFKGVGDTVTLQETGTYRIEVTAREANLTSKFNGELNFTTVEQHVEVPNLFFEGTSVSNYPNPENQTVEGVEANIFYTYGPADRPEKVVMMVKRDASICKGLSSISECVPNPDLRKIQDQADTISNLKGENTAKDFLIGFIVVVFGGYIAIGRRKRSISGLQKTQYQMDYGFSTMVPGKGLRKWNPDNYLNDNGEK